MPLLHISGISGFQLAHFTVQVCLCHILSEKRVEKIFFSRESSYIVGHTHITLIVKWNSV